MIVGQKGVKYGLQTRHKLTAAGKQSTGPLAAFAADSEDDEDVGQQVQKQAARKVADTKVQEMYAAALTEDPTVFDYDGVYDSIQQQKVVPKQRDKVARQPKYIASLLEQAATRKREQDITFEKQLLKERLKEDHLYENQEKFITSAYRRKLEEDKKWHESQRLKDLEEERNDVTKLGHMNNFFHKLTGNVALGGTAAASAPPSLSVLQHAEQPSKAEDAAGGSQPPDALSCGENQQQPLHRPATVQQQQHCDVLPEHDIRKQQQGHQQQQICTASAAHPTSQLGIGTHAGADSQGLPSRQQAAGAGADKAWQQQLPLAGGKRKNDDAAVAAARERYLARKKWLQGPA